MATKPDVPPKKLDESKCVAITQKKAPYKPNEGDILLKRMETLTNDKMKLRNMIQEHRRIISQLQSEES
jgi:hypothetical protein